MAENKEINEFQNNILFVNDEQCTLIFLREER